MTSSDVTDPETETTQSASPGGLLRSAREARKVSLEEIADALNLPTTTVAALERDNYANFPGRTYVRGYLVSYARYLSLDTSQIDRAFASIYPPVNSPEKNFQRLKSDSSFAKSGGFPRSGLFLLLTLIIVAATYIFWDRLAGVADTAPPLIAPEDTATRSLSTAPNGTLVSPPANNEANTLLNEPADQTGPPRRDTNPAVVPTTSSAADRSDGSSIESPGAAPANENPPNQPGKSELLLQFAAESWADIRASDGTKLLYNLQPAGSEISLSVVLPIKIFLGNAPDVKIFYNGALYDQPIRGRIAQFTLTAADASH